MNNKIVPVVIEATGELVGTASLSLPDENGKMNANILITNTELLKRYKGQIKILVNEKVKSHNAFLNSYSEEDEGLYD